MSYTALESSKDSGKPIFLYEFVQGDNIWRFNSSAIDFVWSAQTWEASSISHGEVTQSNEMAKDNLTLKFSRTNEFARQFLGYAPDLVTSVIIRRGHISDGEFVVYWRGRVVSAKASNQLLNIECESVFTSLRRPGLRARYQRTCRHALYLAGCGLNKAAFQVNGQLSNLSGVTLIVPEAASQAAGWFIGGMLGYKTHLRLIVNHVGDTLTISRPIDELTTDYTSAGYGVSYGSAYGNLSVAMYPGCDRSLDTCNTKFNNIANFGGFPWIPIKNPFGGSSIA